MLKIKRAYQAPEPTDGQRYLVDGLWPRGLDKQRLQIKAWLKELAPSPGLRRWFGHEPARWDQFQERYRQELSEAGRQEALASLAEQARQGTVTLVYAAKDEEHNNAQVLAEVIARILTRQP